MSKPEHGAPNLNKRTLQFDLFAQLSYLAAISTAGVGRSDLFEYAARLPYVSSQYFKAIVFAVKTLNLDYAAACALEADGTDQPLVKDCC